MEAEKTMELFKNSSSDDGDKVTNGEHGIFPSPMEAHGVEETEPIPMCLSDDIVPIPCEHESHLAHLSESKSELSDSTICEFECFLLEGMSDTPSEMRVVVDRSCETISISNNLPSTSSVLSTCVLGSMDDETPSDAARHSVLTMSHTISRAPTYIKSSWTSKVNSILYTSPIPPHMNGILLHTPSHGYARLVTRSTGVWEEDH